MSLNKHVADNLRISVEVCLGFSQGYIVDLCCGYGGLLSSGVLLSGTVEEKHSVILPTHANCLKSFKPIKPALPGCIQFAGLGQGMHWVG